MLVNMVDDPSTNPYMRSIVQCGPGGCLLDDPTLVHLHSPSKHVLNEGDSYRQEWDEVHQTYADDGTVTIVRRVDYREPRAAAVYWPYGEQWVSSDPVIATPKKIQNIADNALRTWFQ
jgi:hypothetical protein